MERGMMPSPFLCREGLTNRRSVFLASLLCARTRGVVISVHQLIFCKSWKNQTQEEGLLFC